MKSAGYAWLIKEYHLQVLEPFQQSYIHERSDRRSCEENGHIESCFSKAYDPGDDWTGNLTFAFKYEGVNLEVLAALLPKIPSAEMEYCPRIRKTKAIREYQMADIAASVRALIASYPSHLIDRASQYLYSKETKSSFEIEREHADTRRTARFIELLRRAGRVDSYGEPELTALQNVIVEERYSAKGFRTSQSYVGESTRCARFGEFYAKRDYFPRIGGHAAQDERI